MSDIEKPNAAQLASPAYRVAALDQEFLLDEALRGVRFMLEYEKAERALRAWESPRPSSSSGRRARIKTATAPCALVRGGAALRLHRLKEWRRARRRSRRPARERDCDRGRRRGHGGGQSRRLRGRRSVDRLQHPPPHEQEPNAYSTPELTFQFHYFGMRKMHFAMRAHALVVFPGGFGTMDELFEILTLTQTGKMPRVPILLFDRSYWSKAVNFEHFVEHGMIAPEDLQLFQYAETPEEAWQALLFSGLNVGPCESDMP